MNRTVVLLLLLLAGLPSPGAEKKQKPVKPTVARNDFNFDGHEDRKEWREADGKRHGYNIFLWDPGRRKHRKSAALSALHNPEPHPARKEIRCLWPAGHSGCLYSAEYYAWHAGKLVLVRKVKQDFKTVGKTLVYVRTTTSIVEGAEQKPVVLELSAEEALLRAQTGADW